MLQCGKWGTCTGALAIRVAYFQALELEPDPTYNSHNNDRQRSRTPSRGRSQGRNTNSARRRVLRLRHSTLYRNPPCNIAELYRFTHTLSTQTLWRQYTQRQHVWLLLSQGRFITAYLGTATIQRHSTSSSATPVELHLRRTTHSPLFRSFFEINYSKG